MIKSFGKIELQSCLENGRGEWNKTMNTLLNKVIGENEKLVFYFYLKIGGTFWPTQYKSSTNMVPKDLKADIFV